VSEHFTSRELACRCCGENRCTPELVAALEALRAAVGNQPIIVHDAYRCVKHNAEVGGAPHSEHVAGLAADISVDGMTAAELEAAAWTVPAIHGTGRGDAQNYLHIDVRNVVSRWCYDATGKQVEYYPPHETEAA